MHNPLKMQKPDDVIVQIHEFARDLAYGSLHEMWPSKFIIDDNHLECTRRSHQKNLTWYLFQKWQNKHPNIHLLSSFGYMITQELEGKISTGLLTDKAFSLLEKPVATDNIFISYSRQSSSVFALFLLHKLRDVGANAFLDIQDIDPGEDWQKRLLEEIENRTYFVCLIDPNTLESTNVQLEINHALKLKKIIVPIFHNGAPGIDLENSNYSDLLKKNSIIIETENPKSYYNAILDLLNFLGYSLV